MKRVVKLYHSVRLFLLGGGTSRAEYLRKKRILGHMGMQVYFHPFWLPSEPELIWIGNNVHVTAGVLFITHDILGGMLNIKEQCENYQVLFQMIEIGDNVSIGARSIIMPGVKIGPNVVVAAGSVVTKNFSGGEKGIVIGGNPAKVIHMDWESLREKRRIAKE